MQPAPFAHSGPRRWRPPAAALAALPAAALALLLAACGASGALEAPSPPAPVTVQASVQDWSAGAQPLHVVVADRLHGRGAIGQDGAFEAPLPAASDVAGQLSTVASGSCQGGSGSVVVEPSGLRMAGPAMLALFARDVPVGVLLEGFVEVAGGAVSAASVDRFYADRDARIAGTCTLTLPEGTLTVTYDIALRAGWNRIVTELPPTALEATAAHFTVRAGGAPKARWSVYALAPASGPAAQGASAIQRAAVDLDASPEHGARRGPRPAAPDLPTPP